MNRNYVRKESYKENIYGHILYLIIYMKMFSHIIHLISFFKTFKYSIIIVYNSKYAKNNQFLKKQYFDCLQNTFSSLILPTE